MEDAVCGVCHVYIKQIFFGWILRSELPFVEFCNIPSLLFLEEQDVSLLNCCSWLRWSPVSSSCKRGSELYEHLSDSACLEHGFAVGHLVVLNEDGFFRRAECLPVAPHVLSRAVHQLHWFADQNLVKILQLYICDMYNSYVSYPKVECIFIIWIIFLFGGIDSTVEI